MAITPPKSSILVVHATNDAAVVESRIVPFLRGMGFTPTLLAQPAAKKGELQVQFDWYLVLASPHLQVAERPQLKRIIEQFPERVLPARLSPCDPGKIHPRLDFLIPYDFSGDLTAISQRWCKEGVIRPRPDLPFLMFLSMKGGVAKTTNAVAVAECLAQAGNRVLVIDTDHQCAASALLLDETRTEETPEGRPTLEEADARKRTLVDLFREMISETFDPNRIEHFIHKGASNIGPGISNLSVLPSSIRIEEFFPSLRKTTPVRTTEEHFRFLKEKRMPMLKKWLAHRYEYILIDCPPSVPWQVHFFLSVADALVIPTSPTYLSVRGVRYLGDKLDRMRLSRIKTLGTLWSMVQSHSSHTKIMSEADVPTPFQTRIPHSTKVTEAMSDEKRPKTFAAKYPAPIGETIHELCREIQTRMILPVSGNAVVGV